MRPDVMRARLADARVGRLATISSSGEPHVVPVCFVLLAETVWTVVDAKPKRSPRLRRLANIAVNPAASLLVDHYSEDWARLWWVRLDGVATVVAEGADREAADREAAIRALATKYEQYAASPPNGPAIALQVRRWSGWSADPLD